jgi:RimJ/RimL family protein N-acetyltransferase
MAEVVAETERLRLREWEEPDARAFYDVMNTPAVMKHLGGVQTFEGWLEGFERLRLYQREHGHTFWIIEERASGEILGFCGLKLVNSPGAGEELRGMPEIGWRLRESAWGMGIAKEAAIATLDLAFGRLGYGRVIAMTIPANRDSLGLMRRLAMKRREKLDFIDTRFGPETNPQIVYAIDATDWPAAKAAVLA